MISNSEIRARARQKLENNIFSEKWLFALLVGLLALVITGAASSIPFAPLIIAGPIGVGVASVFMATSRTGEKPKIEDMFNGFKDFVPNLLLGLMVSIFTFLWSLLFIIPGIVKSYSYSMSYYIKNDHPEYDWQQCMNESKRMMKGNKGRLFCLHFSFFGWMLLGLLCCGIGMLWVTPYMSLSTAEFYNDLISKEPEVNETNETNETNDTNDINTNNEETISL